ncbi:MAG: LytTR family DNA-binding domain-containing protein [Bacteroidota bacterium]
MQIQLPTYWPFRFRFSSNLEFILHVLLWTLYFATINVEWTGPWVKQTFLPQSVAPHIGLLFPIAFIANAFWLVPMYLNKRHWWRYGLILGSVILVFETVRASLFAAVLEKGDSFLSTFQGEFIGNNSFIFGTLSFMLLNALFWSFLYRVTWDWFLHGKKQQTGTTKRNINSGTATLAPKAFFSIKKGKGTLRLAVDEVVCFQAQGDFVLAIDQHHRKYIINTSLKKVFAELREDEFFQINRSEIVHKKYITGYQKHIKNRLVIQTVLNEFPLYSSNSRTPAFRRWIKATQ